MIAAVEAALVERLKLGLGRMVTRVELYGGELDDELANVVRTLPAVWITFAGMSKAESYSTTRRTWIVPASFAVMVGQRHLVGRTAARNDSPAGDPGASSLVQAVRRLLIGQDLGLTIDSLKPGAVRTLYNTRLDNAGSVAAYSVEFHTRWSESALDNGAWPAPGELPFAGHDGHAGYAGQTTPEAPMLERIGMNYIIKPGDDNPDITDVVTLS